ncbi:hypothetical protein O3P69_002778 [Scylla paramamosain]|uniref:Uncharacterized protein n=1 Tax=Scylla paramamosain TaxID=85552 RepID=A0AAW0UQG0_SCYPA
MQEYGGEEGHVRWKAEANSPLVNQVGDSMEDPVSPATPGAESLWNADSDASSELSDIYGDIDDHAARNLEAEDVDDADIFQELGRIADEEKQLSSYRASFEAQGNSGLIFDVYSQNQRKENCQTEQTTSELTDGKMTPTCDSNVLGHNLSQTEKDYARKEEKSEALIDFMNVGDASTTEKKTNSYTIPKKIKKESQDNQLDLFEDFLVGQDRDELLQELKKLKAEQEQLQESLRSSQQRCLGLEKDNETLLNNMSSLWKTSVSQLRQKTNELTTLKREKEAIIFRRAMRQVPKDELDRVVSHIAAYDKEELKDFINSLKEEKEEKKECMCSRGTTTPGRSESVGQRVRQATRGVRLSPSSDSEAQTLKNLLGKKGETVTHSEEKLRTWNVKRGLSKDGVPDAKTPQGKMEKMHHVKKAVELSDKCMEKVRPFKEPQDESLKDRTPSGIQVSSISESADAPHSTTMKHESLGAHLSKDPAPAQENGDETGVPSGFEDEMLSKTLFGQRMKNRLKNLSKPHLTIEQEQTLSSPSSPNVHTSIPKPHVETTPTHRQIRPQDKSKATITSPLENVRKVIPAESKAQSEDKVTIRSDEEVDVQNESKSRDKSQTTLRSGEDHSSMFEVKHRKHHTKDRTKKIRSDAKKHKDSDIQNVEEQAKEKTNSEKKNESKKTSLDMKQKSGKSEHKTNTKETEDTVPVTQNTDERNGVTTSKRKSKKKHASDESNDKEKSSDTTKGGSLQQKKNDGKILTRTPTPVLDEEMSSDDEDEEDAEVDVELNKSPVQSPRMENILLEHEALDGIKQQDQSDGKQMRDAEGKKKNVKNNPEKNPDEDLEGERTNVIKDKKIGEEDYSNITHDRNDECQDNVRKEREVTSQDTMSSIDDQDNDILQSLLGTNYNEDSLFLSEEELLYEDGCEKEDEEEEERNSVHDQKIKYGSDSKNDHKESIVEEEQKLKKQTESKELNEKTDRVCDLDTKVSITESISSPRRSGRERGRDTPKGKPHGSYGGRDDTDTTKKSVDKQSRGDAHTPKTGEKENCSRSPSHSPSPQKGNLSKPLGSRIKKLFPSTSSRRQQGREEGVSPLMAREERLQSKRTEKQEPLSKRAEKQEPQSKRGERQEQQSKRVEKQESHKRLEKQEPQNRRSERQESRHSRDETGNLRPKDKDRRKDAEEHNRKRESHSPHVLSSQNRKSPPRLRKGRKRERSESEVSGKKDWSPRKKGERSSPRKRESREDKEEPASKKRRVSVKSRLTLPPNSDEENMTRPARWQPSTPETQRTRRISSRLRNQSHVADEHMREPGWQGGTQYASKTPETQKKSSPSSVPVDSKLLRSILTQSSSKCMEQEDEKEEGELDEDEEEGKEEDGCVDEPMKNHNKDNETCDTVSKKMNDIGRQPLKPKEHNSNMEDKGKTLQIKEHKASKHNACVDSRDTQDGKSCETDKQNIPVAADKEHYEQKNADSKIVIPDRTLDSEISPERVQYTACGIEGQNNPRSSKKRGEPEKQQYSQSKASSPRMTSLVQDAVQHQDMKTRRNRRKTLEYLSEDRKEDEDHNRENCTPVDDNATFYPGDLFQLMQPKAKGHLPPDLSMSSISSVSDDTIDLMVKQHNENFPFDITNGSDDSETSLLKYIAGSEEDRCDDNEVYEQKERTKGNNCVPNSDNDSCDEDEVNDEKVKGTLPENLHNLETKEIVLNSNTGISKRKTRLMHENEQVSPHDNDLSGEEYTKDTEFAMQIHKEVTTKGMEKITQQCYKDTSESRSPVRCGSESALSYSSTSSESKSPFKCGSENVSPSSSASSESKSPVRCGSQNVSSSSSASGESKSPVRCESQNMSSSSNTSDSRADTERQDIPIHSAVCTTHPSNTEEEDIRGTTVCQTNITEADMDEQDQQSSSDDEDDSELDVENTDGETDEHTRKLAENNCRTTSDGQYFTRREHEDNAVVEDLPSETRPITESEKANNEANSSDDSDSDSDCECSECNSSSSSSSSSSSGSSSSSSSSDSSSSDSEMEDAGVDGVEDLEKSMFGGEKNSVPVNHMASGVQSCDQESSKTVPASPIKLVSPTKLGCKTPKKTPRKTSSRTHMTELSESSGSMGAFKKTPKKPPCKKTPCKKTVSKDAQSRTPKAKRVHASLPASTERQPQDTVHTSSEKSGHFHSLFEPSNENGINEDHKTSQADLGNSDMQTSLRWSLQQSEDTVRTRHNTSTPQTNTPSMPFIETADAPDKRSSFGPSPGRTAQLSCTDSNNVISVVHNSKKNVNQVPKKTSSRTPKKVIQKEAVTTTPTVEKSTAKKRRLTPTLVVSNVRNSSGKKMRMIAPAMYEGVSPRKLFARTDKINQERNSPLLSSPGSSVGSPEPTKNSINKDIVVPVKVRRAKRQLNLGLSSSPVQHIYMGKQSLGQSNAADSGSLHGGASQAGGGMTPAQQKTGDSSGQVLRRSPRKSQQSSKLSI